MNIYEALRKDHENIIQLLNELVSLRENSHFASLPEGETEHRHALIAKIRDELVPHSRAEEAIFYNSLRTLDAAKDITSHGFSEHMEADALLRWLQVQDKIDAGWKSSASRLRDSLWAHIDEEEGVVFSVAQQLLTDDEASMMGEAFVKMKAEIKEEGFVKTTFDLIVNMIPPRFTSSFRGIDLENRMS